MRASPKAWQSWWRIRGLCEALMVDPDKAATEYALQRVDDFVVRKWEAVDFGDEKALSRANWTEGEFLLNLLRGAPANLREQMTRRVLENLGKTGGLGVANAAYALCEARAMSFKTPPKELKPVGVRDYAALGVHWSAQVRSSWWDHETASALRLLALDLAADERLRAHIKKTYRP